MVTSLGDGGRRNGLNLYLKTLPEETEKIKVKQLMLESMITGKRSALPMNKSLVSLLSGNSGYNDSQLEAYAQVIEDMKKPDQ